MGIRTAGSRDGSRRKSIPKAYADFQILDDFNRLRLTCAGTLQDLERQGIQLLEGLVLTLYTDDADDQDQPDELRAEGVVHYDEDGRCWVATVDWAAIRHASDEVSLDGDTSVEPDSGAVKATSRQRVRRVQARPRLR